ncbi:MAG: HNH endonuclease [Acidobacteria bacterium]|nr:HNH endonuclease [Acidobacteriota bacterium]
MPATGDNFITAKNAFMGLGPTCHQCNRKISADWSRRNKEKAVQKNIRYQHRLAVSGDWTAQDQQNLFDLFHHHCVSCCQHESVCGKLEADHVVPLFLGGTSSFRNRQPLCRRCNAKKAVQVIDYRPSFLSRIRRAA